MISSQKSILWPYQYSLSISTTSPISRYLEAAIIWDVKIYIVKCCKKKRQKTITCGFQVPRVPRRTRAWMQEVWGLHTWGQIIHFHCFYLLLVKGAGGSSDLRSLMNETFPYNAMQWITDPYLAKSPHIWHIACEVAKFASDQEL